MLKKLALLSVLAMPTAALAAPVWSSNFEDGTLAAWTRAQTVADDRLQIVADPVREGSQALAVTVRQFDDPVSSGNDRAELVNLTHEPEGSEYWYRFSVMFPEDYPSHPRWQLFFQWHQDGLGGTPPFEMFVAGEEMRMRTGGNESEPLWVAPLVRGVWHDFVMHIRWSSDPSVGFVEMFHNGEPAVAPTSVPTMLPGQLSYMKMGLYRSREIATDATIYFDDIRMGTELADVMDPAQPAVASVPGETAGTPTSPTGTTGTQPGIGNGTTGDPNSVVSPSDPTNGPDEGGIPVDPSAAEMGASCSMSTTSAALPVAGALALLVLWSVATRRRATVTVPVKRAGPSRRR